MTYSVTLEKQTSLSDPTELQPTSVRVIYTVTIVVSFPDKGIFTYQIDSVTGVPFYVRVVTPKDIQDYNYQVAGGKAFVRDDNVTQTFDTGELAEEFMTELEALIQVLCTDMAVLDTYNPAVTVAISS